MPVFSKSLQICMLFTDCRSLAASSGDSKPKCLETLIKPQTIICWHFQCRVAIKHVTIFGVDDYGYWYDHLLLLKCAIRREKPSKNAIVMAYTFFQVLKSLLYPLNGRRPRGDWRIRSYSPKHPTVICLYKARLKSPIDYKETKVLLNCHLQVRPRKNSWRTEQEKSTGYRASHNKVFDNAVDGGS